MSELGVEGKAVGCTTESWSRWKIGGGIELPCQSPSVRQGRNWGDLEMAKRLVFSDDKKQKCLGNSKGVLSELFFRP